MAVILGVPSETLRRDIADRTTAVSQRYHRGKAASRVKLLHQEMQLAYVGSPLALETLVTTSSIWRMMNNSKFSSCHN